MPEQQWSLVNKIGYQIGFVFLALGLTALFSLYFFQVFITGGPQPWHYVAASASVAVGILLRFLCRQPVIKKQYKSLREYILSGDFYVAGIFLIVFGCGWAMFTSMSLWFLGGILGLLMSIGVGVLLIGIGIGIMLRQVWAFYGIIVIVATLLLWIIQLSIHTFL